MTSTTPALRIRRMTQSDVEEVAQLFAHTIARETFHKLVAATQEELLPVARALVKISDFSFVCEDPARAEGDRIVGFRLSHELDATLSILDREPFTTHAPFMGTALFVHEWATLHPEITQDEHKDGKRPRVLHLFGLGTREGYERRGCGGDIVDITLVSAKKEGFELALVESAAAEAKRIFEKMGFKKVYDVPLANFEFQSEKNSNVTVVIYELDLVKWQPDANLLAKL